MNQKEWLDHERQALEDNAQSENPDPWEQGYYAAVINALNNLSGMTENRPDLASGYLPGEVKNRYLNPSVLRVMAMELEEQGITGMNVALALDLMMNHTSDN